MPIGALHLSEAARWVQGQLSSAESEQDEKEGKGGGKNVPSHVQVALSQSFRPTPNVLPTAAHADAHPLSAEQTDSHSSRYRAARAARPPSISREHAFERVWQACETVDRGVLERDGRRGRAGSVAGRVLLEVRVHGVRDCARERGDVLAFWGREGR